MIIIEPCPLFRIQGSRFRFQGFETRVEAWDERLRLKRDLAEYSKIATIWPVRSQVNNVSVLKLHDMSTRGDRLLFEITYIAP